MVIRFLAALPAAVRTARHGAGRVRERSDRRSVSAVDPVASAYLPSFSDAGSAAMGRVIRGQRKGAGGTSN
jgi:hypothetical protein